MSWSRKPKTSGRKVKALEPREERSKEHETIPWHKCYQEVNRGHFGSTGSDDTEVTDGSDIRGVLVKW